MPLDDGGAWWCSSGAASCTASDNATGLLLGGTPCLGGSGGGIAGGDTGASEVVSAGGGVSALWRSDWIAAFILTRLVWVAALAVFAVGLGDCLPISTTYLTLPTLIRILKGTTPEGPGLVE